MDYVDPEHDFSDAAVDDSNYDAFLDDITIEDLVGNGAVPFWSVAARPESPDDGQDHEAARTTQPSSPSSVSDSPQGPI
jgi:hypothetical protein